MACLYKRSGSRFWWVEYVDVAGRRRQESTKLDYEVPGQTRRAQELRRELTAREKSEFDSNEMWERWVPRFLEQRYRDPTLARYKNSWKNISAFLRVAGIYIPRQLSRQQVRDFVDWRQGRHSELGIYEVCKNTALHEIKLLRVLMNEAVLSGFCGSNPCARLDIRKDPAPKKPRITEQENEVIQAALLAEPEWMRVSYEIAYEQGCRFSETCLPLSDVDLRRNVIRFRTKGRKDAFDQFPLSPKLRPLFRRLMKRARETGRRPVATGGMMTFEMPAMPGKSWWRFFRRIGLRHLCFHCTRVTFISRCYERGVPREMVMRLVGHSTTAAHEIYPRIESSSQLLQEMRKLL